MNKKLFLWAVTSALAGLLFGFDTVVISGAESKIQQLWSLSGAAHGLAISAALWGTVLGALLGSWPARAFGRRKVLIFNGVLFILGAAGTAFAQDVWTFGIFRFIGGVGIGISTIAAPLFISEIAPAEHRGKLTGMFQFNIVFGILLAFFSNSVIMALAPEDVAWRYMLGIQLVPAVVYTVMCFSLPESPRWLIVDAHKEAEGRKVFASINPTYSDRQLDDLVASVKESAAAESSKKQSKVKFFTWRLRYPILFAFLIAAFNQLSGINIILYFAPRLLGLAGMENPLTASIALGVTNLIFTFVGLRLIDMLGRKTLLTIGCIGYIVSLAVCAFAFLHFTELKAVSTSIDVTSAVTQVQRMENHEVYFTPADQEQALQTLQSARSAFAEVVAQDYPDMVAQLNAASDLPALQQVADSVHQAASADLGAVSMIVLVCMIVFIASHAVGSGTIIWVFISEIFPNEVRAQGQSLGSSTHWVFAAVLTLLFPVAIAHFDAGVMMGFFCVMMVLQLLWCRFMMPETKGRTLEEISAALTSK